MNVVSNPLHYHLYLIRFYTQVCWEICPPRLNWKYSSKDRVKGILQSLEKAVLCSLSYCCQTLG